MFQRCLWPELSNYLTPVVLNDRKMNSIFGAKWRMSNILIEVTYFVFWSEPRHAVMFRPFRFGSTIQARSYWIWKPEKLFRKAAWHIQCERLRTASRSIIRISLSRTRLENKKLLSTSFLSEPLRGLSVLYTHKDRLRVVVIICFYWCVYWFLF